MRKNGIFILLGVIISLSIFVVAGILYFHPAVEAKRMQPTAAQIPQTPTATQQVEVKKPIQTPKPKVQEVPKEIEEPVVEEVRKPEIAKPAPVKVVAKTYTEPEVEVEEEVEEKLEEKLELEEELPLIPTPETPYRTIKAILNPPTIDFSVQSVLPEVPHKQVEMKMAKERIAPKVEFEGRPVMLIPAPPKINLSALAPLPAIFKGTRVVQAVEKQRIQPQVDIEARPARYAPVLADTSMVVLPPIAKPDPSTYIWTPVVVPEGPEIYTNPVLFQEEAIDRRRSAVDEVLESLIWP